MDIGGLHIDFEWKTWNNVLSNMFEGELIHEVYRNHPVMVTSSLVIYYTHLLNVPMDTLVQDILPYARNEFIHPQVTISVRLQHKRDREQLTLQVTILQDSTSNEWLSNTRKQNVLRMMINACVCSPWGRGSTAFPKWLNCLTTKPLKSYPACHLWTRYKFM
eukprot:PhF_6_TR7029/c0_g3_i2/m.10531